MRAFLSVFTHIWKNLLLLNFLFSGMFVFPLYIAQYSMSFTLRRATGQWYIYTMMCFIWYIMWSLFGNMEIKLHFDRNVIRMPMLCYACMTKVSLSTEEVDIWNGFGLSTSSEKSSNKFFCVLYFYFHRCIVCAVCVGFSFWKSHKITSVGTSFNREGKRVDREWDVDCRVEREPFISSFCDFFRFVLASIGL